jgi:holo-[acyl-carrier protein] synthase
MDMEIGVDCEEISRFNKMADKNRLLKKIFTKKEIDFCLSRANPSQHFAARFSGKEAVIKALGSFGKKITFKHIEILNQDSGAPMVNLRGDDLEQYGVMLSLSHSKNTAVAFALALKK